MSYLFVSFILTEFKVWEKVFGDQMVLGKRTESGKLVVLLSHKSKIRWRYCTVRIAIMSLNFPLFHRFKSTP